MLVCVLSEDIKPAFSPVVAAADVAENVASYLRKKHCDENVTIKSSFFSPENSQRASLDFGGIALLRWKMAEFALPSGLTAAFFAHHLDQLYCQLHAGVAHAERKGRDFCLIDTALWTIALSKSDVEALISIMKENNSSLRELERRELDDYERALAGLRDCTAIALPEQEPEADAC